LVKLILRNKEYEVKPGMNLLSALQKINVIPESVIATRDGEMILDDEILKDGDVVKLVAVISGGSLDDNSIFDTRWSNIENRISNNEYRQ
jgi:sulfur carrier protein